jgi:hypothetical protein
MLSVRNFLRLSVPVIFLIGICSASSAVTIKSPNRQVELDPFGIYRVDIVCHQKTLPVDDLAQFMKNNVTASLLFAITDQNYTGVFPSPDRAKAIVSVYAVGGGTTNRSSFINLACNTTFFVPARKKLYLVAASAKIDNHVLGPAGNGIYDAVNVVSSAWSLFIGAAIPGAAGRRVSAIKDSEGPVASILTHYDKGHSPTANKMLYQGTQKIEAEYGWATVSVTRLRSIVDLSATDPKLKHFRADLQDTISTVYKGGLKSSDSLDQISASCRGEDDNMRNLANFGSYDSAYSLSFLARLAGFSAEQIIHCLGKDYALTAAHDFMKLPFVDEKTTWHKEEQFTENDVNVVLPPATSKILQPQFKDVSKRLGAILGGMRLYSTLEKPTPTDKVALSAFLAESVDAADSTGLLEKPDELIANDKLMERLSEKKITRFGCLMADADSLAMFLGVPEKPSQGLKYQLNEVVLMRLWLNASQSLSSLAISYDEPTIQTIIKNSCGPTLSFASPG